MNMEQLKEFVALENRKKELDSELKAIAAQLDDLEQSLVPQFLEDGVQSMKIDGRVVYVAQDIYPSPASDRAAVVEALKKSELGQYVSENFNSQSLRAFVREVAEEVRLQCEQQDKLLTEEAVLAALPAPLGQALKVSFIHSLRSRKT
ncbi:MAG: hypothetical protein A3J28_09240 [Acidobacteria bacterium RIFCSPLOWO2_12_FULL_60_22]|nr:MAG: hypothetical protein A3J28_09240 [Acidobacteria bacterium RIFCSPLOWO2_12_FULL_60_22]